MDFAPQTLPFPSSPLDHLSSIGVGEKRSIVLNFCLIHNHNLLANPILVNRDRPNLESILDFSNQHSPHLPINFQSPAKSQSNDEARPASGITQLEIRVVVRKKTGLCGENSQVADPLPPVWELSHFVIVFLPFYKPLNWKNREKYGRFGSDPSPPLGIFPT